MKPKTEGCKTPGRPFVIGRKDDTKTAMIFQPNCGLWTCPYCSQQKKAEWFLIAFKGTSHFLESGLQVAMITVTSRGGKGRTRERSMQSFKDAWPILRKRARYYQKTFEYIMIPEQHKNGVMHIHLIATNELKQRWWKDTAFAVGLGFMAHVSALQDAGIGAAYVSKYIDKHLEFGNWPKGFRRVRTSQGWPRLSAPTVESDMLYDVYLDYGKALWDAHMLTDAGYEVIDKTDPENREARPTRIY